MARGQQGHLTLDAEILEMFLPKCFHSWLHFFHPSALGQQPTALYLLPQFPCLSDNVKELEKALSVRQGHSVPSRILDSHAKWVLLTQSPTLPVPRSHQQGYPWPTEPDPRSPTGRRLSLPFSHARMRT